jgi:hypothetical protein
MVDKLKTAEKPLLKMRLGGDEVGKIMVNLVCLCADGTNERAMSPSLFISWLRWFSFTDLLDMIDTVII